MALAGLGEIPKIMPYSGLSPAKIRIIDNAIALAWADVRQEVTDCDEDEITLRIVEHLNHQLNDAGTFTADVFETVGRSEELANYDGLRIKKKPDLVFRECGRRPGYRREYRGLFVECKVVDRTHPVSLYCRKGIARFVEGDYAWALRQGMMLAYAIGTQRIKPHLDRHLTKFAADYNTEKPLHRKANGVWHSAHRRTWAYDDGTPPGNIVLRHVWLT